MSDLICPHCHGSVSHGAKVCRGCQAEIEYGAPGFTFVVLLIISIYLGFKTSNALPESMSFLCWITGVSVFAGGSFLLAHIFEHRVNFKRIYRTR